MSKVSGRQAAKLTSQESGREFNHVKTLAPEEK